MDDRNTKSFVCQKDAQRLDQFLAEQSGLSRTRVVQLIESDSVLVNNERRSKRFLLKSGDVVSFYLPEDQEIDAQPQNLPLDIFYEDDDIIVVNKPQGMVVHPAPGNPDGTLVNALLFHCKDSLSGINGKLRPGIVHRIDKDTSGLLIVAKNDSAHNALSEMFQNHTFTRKYHAIVYGNIKSDSGTISLSIGRSKNDRKKMAAYPIGTPNTKDAITHFQVLERFQGYTYVELTLETGRTHQIRVHLQSISSPVLADPVYAPGRKTLGLSGQCLHAKIIGFKHPITGKELYFDSPLPAYFQNTLDFLRSDSCLKNI